MRPATRSRVRASAAAASAAFLALALALPGVSAADTDFFTAKPQGQAIKVTEARSRTSGQRLLIGGLIGGAVLCAGAGLYFHLDSRSASNEVSRVDQSNEVWTRDRQDTYDRAHRSRTGAIVGYAGGGAILIAAAVVLIVTDPGTEVKDTGIAKVAGGKLQGLALSPLEGGALMEAAWRF
jgi:hypothetical protein